jgi:hypothetical protein
MQNYAQKEIYMALKFANEMLDFSKKKVKPINN